MFLTGGKKKPCSGEDGRVRESTEMPILKTGTPRRPKQALLLSFPSFKVNVTFKLLNKIKETTDPWD